MVRSLTLGTFAALLWIIANFGLSGGTAAMASERTRDVRSVTEMRHHNVVLQQWELSCAAASLATILRYQHGMPVTERSVALGLINRTEYISNPNLVRMRHGFSLLDLKRYVDGVGYEGVGLGQLDLPDLRALAPIIVPVNLQGYPHFVVFRGATSREVLLADPAFGNVNLSIETFMSGWIEYRDLQRVGFVVNKEGMQSLPGRLSPQAMDFILLRQ